MAVQGLIGYNNYVLMSALPVGAAQANLPIGNLQIESGAPSQAWQTPTGVVTAAAGAHFFVHPPVANQAWRVAGLFRSNLTASATMRVQLFRPGVIPGTYTTLYDGVAPNPPAPGYGQIILVMPSDVLADFALVQIDDPLNPDGFINIPLAFLGPAWLPLSPASYDTVDGADDSVDENESRGGQEHPNYLWSRRRREISFMGVRESEVLSGWRPLDNVARRGNNILYIPDIASDTINQEALYGRMRSTSDLGYPYGGSGRRSWRVRHTERL